MKIQKFTGGEKHFDAELCDTDDPLRPCPFCGESIDLELAHTWTEAYWVQCNSCGAEVGDSDGRGESGTRAGHIKSAKRAVKAWNTRAV